MEKHELIYTNNLTCHFKYVEENLFLTFWTIWTILALRQEGLMAYRPNTQCLAIYTSLNTMYQIHLTHLVNALFTYFRQTCLSKSSLYSFLHPILNNVISYFSILSSAISIYNEVGQCTVLVSYKFTVGIVNVQCLNLWSYLISF